AALQSDAKTGEFGRFALRLIGFNQSLKGRRDSAGKHCVFRTAFLLLKDKQRLPEIWIPPLDLLLQDLNLRMLAPEAQHCGAHDVGIMNVPGDEAAKVVRVLKRAAAAALVQKKSDSINIRKKPPRWLTSIFICCNRL